MVRVDSNESQADEKKETTQKKVAIQRVAVKRKNPSSGIWPCTMNGCNKQFAREADLKRHQRTTKSHSNPGFACPQCDATFTRMDALRRHQRSRHNGVADQNRSQELESSNSRSSSATPSLKGKERADHPRESSNYQPPPTTYYRQHTSSSTSPNRLPPIQTPPLPPINSLTSTNSYQSAHSWSEGNPQMSTIIYHTLPGPGQPYYTSSNYRLRLSNLHHHPKDEHRRSASISSESRSSTPSLNAPKNTGSISYHSRESSAQPSEPVIDPSLEAESSQMLDAKQNRRNSGSDAGDKRQLSPPVGRGTPAHLILSKEAEKGEGDDHDVETDMEGSDASEIEAQLKYTRTPSPKSENVPTFYMSTITNPTDSVEQDPSEDDQPMLKPEELLTQESLASPSPSSP